MSSLPTQPSPRAHRENNENVLAALGVALQQDGGSSFFSDPEIIWNLLLLNRDVRLAVQSSWTTLKLDVTSANRCAWGRSLAQLTSLKKLEVSCDPWMQPKVSPALSALVHLTSLSVGSVCSSTPVRQFPTSLQALTLRYSMQPGCGDLIHVKLQHLSHLTSLYLHTCRNRVAKGSRLPSSLLDLHVRVQDRQSVLPNLSIAACSQLTRMVLSSSERAAEDYEKLGALTSVEDLNITAHGAGPCPKAFGSFPALRTLRLVAVGSCRDVQTMTANLARVSTRLSVLDLGCFHACTSGAQDWQSWMWRRAPPSRQQNVDLCMHLTDLVNLTALRVPPSLVTDQEIDELRSLTALTDLIVCKGMSHPLLHMM